METCLSTELICYTVFICLVTSTLCNPMDHRLPDSSVHGDSPGKNTGVGCHTLFQEIFPPRDQTQVIHIASGFYTI